MKKLFLVDVSAMYFRAFYAIRPLSNSKEMPTNALYGFLSMTVKLLKEQKPDYMAFCFDRKEASFRKDVYPEYKANRGPMPEDLVPQVPYVKKITDALGIPAFEKEKYEADDVIGSLCRFGKESDLEVVIVSGDKDFAQLIGPTVSMLDTMKNKKYDEAGVLEKWGVETKQFKDYLALIGDASDNIPGVRGIGPKGAEKLLKEFSNLEEIYESLEKIKNPNLVKKLTEAKDVAFLSKELVTIVEDLKFVEDKKELLLKEVDRDSLTELLEELDFQSFLRNLLGLVKTKDDDGETNTTEDKVSSILENVKRVDIAASLKNDSSEKKWELDEEVKDVDSVGLAEVINDGDHLWAIFNERGLFFSPYSKKVNQEGGKRSIYQYHDDPLKIESALEGKEIIWSGFDLKKIWKEILAKNVSEKKKAKQYRPEWDSMLAAYVVKAEKVNDFNKTFSDYTKNTVSDLPTPSELFNCEFELQSVLKEKLKKQYGEDVLESFEIPLIPVLYDMENIGIKLNSSELSEQSESLTERIKEVEELIYEESGEIFNVASPKQLSKILFEKMGIEPLKKNKTGFSTNSDVLEKLAVDHKIAEYLIEYREISKLKSTYVDALPLLVNKETGRLHTSFQQAHTATGRLSSQNPNLQNIPIRTELGSKVRSAFIAEKGNKLLSIDYSQIELRILAHVTGDKALSEAFKKDQDIHAATASEIYSVNIDDVTAEQRRGAKAVNFGIAYGQGAFGLAESLGISRKEAAEIIKQYFLKFPKVADYMVDVVEKGKENEYVETVFGRRRYIDELNSSNGRLRKFGERAAINAPIQGTASDIVKKAMIELSENGVGKMLLQVHDEIIFEVPESDVAAVTKKAKEIMENIVSLDIPLKVNSASGDNWQEAHG